MSGQKFIVIAGPCVIESEDNVMYLAEAIRDIAGKFGVDFYFKASWDKANRTKAQNYRGPGLDEGLRILKKAHDELGWTAQYDIEDMCRDSWRWQSTNPNGYPD